MYVFSKELESSALLKIQIFSTAEDLNLENVTPCRLINLDWRFQVPYRLQFRLHTLGLRDLEDKGATTLWNVCNYLQIHTV